jgi:hypothetical protein
LRECQRKALAKTANCRYNSTPVGALAQLVEQRTLNP